MKIQRKNEYLEEAINSKRAMVVLYIAKKKLPKKRVLQDIVSSSRSKEYVSAYCNLRNARRTFKVSRIISIDGHSLLLGKLEMLLKAIGTIIMIIFVIALFGATFFL